MDSIPEFNRENWVILKMLSNVFPALLKNSVKSLSTTATPALFGGNNPALAPRQIKFPSKYLKPRQVWLEGLDTIDEKKLTILELHPDVFAQAPRIDIIHKNVKWQQLYRYVSFAQTKIKFEVRGGGRKPWPQKGLSFVLSCMDECSDEDTICRVG